MKMTYLLIALLFSMSCARNFKKDYTVIDASVNDIPEWTVDLHDWVKGHDEDKGYRYYSFTSTQTSSESVACELAKAKAIASIASEVSVFIKDNYAHFKEGNSSSEESELSEYMENELYKEVKAHIIGAQLYKSYWEKRQYQKEDSKVKKISYVCSSLVRISKKQLEKAFKRVEKSLLQKNNQKMKDKIKNIVKKSSDNYLK